MRFEYRHWRAIRVRPRHPTGALICVTRWWPELSHPKTLRGCTGQEKERRRPGTRVMLKGALLNRVQSKEKSPGRWTEARPEDVGAPEATATRVEQPVRAQSSSRADHHLLHRAWRVSSADLCGHSRRPPRKFRAARRSHAAASPGRSHRHLPLAHIGLEFQSCLGNYT